MAETKLWPIHFRIYTSILEDCIPIYPSTGLHLVNLSPPPVSVSFLYYFPLSFSWFKMAALSSAESPPPVFNGDSMNRDPERDPGLDELGAGLEPACPGGAANPECQQDIPEEVQWGSQGWRRARLLSGAGLDGDVQETPAVIRIAGGCNALQGREMMHKYISRPNLISCAYAFSQGAFPNDAIYNSLIAVLWANVYQKACSCFIGFIFPPDAAASHACYVSHLAMHRINRKLQMQRGIY